MLEITKDDHSFTIAVNGHPILQHHKDSPCCLIGIGSGNFSMKHGMFKIKEKIEKKMPLIDFHLSNSNNMDSINNQVLIELFSKDGVQLTLELVEEDGLVEIHPTVKDEKINRLWLNLSATSDEAIYGCGEQYSEVNLRGEKVPLWCQEQGVGRGDPLWFTFLANIYKNAGGNRFTTYYPQPTFLSSNNYFCHVKTSSYAIFNFTKKSSHELYFWDVPQKISIGKSSTATETMGNLSSYLGKQPLLPNWVYEGVILSIQGGSEVISQKLEKCEQFGLKVVGVWSQDWSGTRQTSFGKQVFWDWIYDSSLYPELPNFIQKLNKKGIRFLGYINTFLALEGDLYQEASEKGYLVTKPSGEEYHVTITTFPAAIIDLTNKEAVNWLKKTIKKNMVDVGLDGWMADFGEYLPTDAILSSGISAESYHNQFPVDWAKLNDDVNEKEGNNKNLVFFTRAGYSHTSSYSPLVWAGDQLVGWSLHDGLASVIPAGISLGVCAIHNFHSDIGGYTTLSRFKRSKELFMRWAELAAFTMVMRTHEGSRP
ncbi:alpha-glucosidase, partial [Candidatus Heimdallarchaeota archaeon]